MTTNEAFYLQHENIYAVPIIHYNMEMAARVRLAFDEIKPDCVAVELAETMQLKLLHAASRLPGMLALEQLMGMILAMMSVEMLVKGMRIFIHTLT